MRLRQVTSDGSVGASHDAAGFFAFDRRDDDVAWPAAPRLMIAEVLAVNRVPAALAERLTRAAGDAADSSDDPIVGLAAALATCFSFASMRTLSRRGAVALVGPPGVGKTTLAAKLAAAVRRGPSFIVDADAKRHGATTQLAEF